MFQHLQFVEKNIFMLDHLRIILHMDGTFGRCLNWTSSEIGPKQKTKEITLEVQPSFRKVGLWVSPTVK